MDRALDGRAGGQARTAGKDAWKARRSSARPPTASRNVSRSANSCQASWPPWPAPSAGSPRTGCSSPTLTWRASRSPASWPAGGCPERYATPGSPTTPGATGSPVRENWRSPCPTVPRHGCLRRPQLHRPARRDLPLRVKLGTSTAAAARGHPPVYWAIQGPLPNGHAA